MKMLTRFLLVAFLANAGAPATASASQLDYKLTDSNKRLRARSAELTNTQQQTAITPKTTEEMLKKEAQLCPLSRHAHLRSILYDLLEQYPLELIDMIISYDSHLLTGKLQCTLHCPIQQTAETIVALSHSKNENVFYAKTEAGVKYWCNAATGVISSARPIIKKNGKKRVSDFPEALKLVRAQAIMHQSIELPDGSFAHADGDKITVKNQQSTVICAFKTGVVTKLLALPDGRLVTGMPNGQIKLWV
jgi:hypothetical protein